MQSPSAHWGRTSAHRQQRWSSSSVGRLSARSQLYGLRAPADGRHGPAGGQCWPGQWARPGWAAHACSGNSACIICVHTQDHPGRGGSGGVLHLSHCRVPGKSSRLWFIGSYCICYSASMVSVAHTPYGCGGRISSAGNGQAIDQLCVSRQDAACHGALAKQDCWSVWTCPASRHMREGPPCVPEVCDRAVALGA